MKKMKIFRTGLVITVWAGLVFIANSGTFEERLAGLPGLFVMGSVACAFFPLPTNVLVLLASQSTSPAAAASVAALATPIAFTLEYQIYSLIIHHGRVLNVRKVEFFTKLLSSFTRRPFSTLTLAAFLPIPAEPLRLYAIASNYSLWRYALAGMAGRVPRYLLIAWIGQQFGAPTWLVIVIVLLPLVIVLIDSGVQKSLKGQRCASP